MKKILKGLFGLMLIVLISIFILGFIFWSKAPDILSSNLSKKLGVPVQIEDMGISPINIHIENFEIGNISSGVLPKAFSVHHLYINTPINRYINQQITIESIVLDQVYLGLEFDSPTSTKGNWTRIMKNLQQNPESSTSQKKSSKGSTSAKTQETQSKSIIIKELRIRNISTELLYLSGQSKIKKLPVIPEIVIKNINSNEGFPVDQLMNSILGQMLEKVFIKENLKNMLENLVPQPSELNDLIQPFKGLFGS